jgi:hypothetical protein
VRHGVGLVGGLGEDVGKSAAGVVISFWVWCEGECYCDFAVADVAVFEEGCADLFVFVSLANLEGEVRR